MSDSCVLPSGVRVDVTARGPVGAPRVAGAKRARVAYAGRLAGSGDVFDSSQGYAVWFDLAALTPGFRAGLEALGVGDRAALHVPAAEAYGERADVPGIPPGSALIFDVVVDAVDAAGASAKAHADAKAAAEAASAAEAARRAARAAETDARKAAAAARAAEITAKKSGGGKKGGGKKA